MPRDTDDTLTKIVLSHLERTDRSFDELKGSMRAARAESRSFRDEVLGRVGKIEVDLKINTALTEGLEKQKKSYISVVKWAVGTLIAVAAILLPLLLSSL